MNAPRPKPVTELLTAWREGSPGAADQLAAAVYGQLRRMAAGYLRRERPGHTLQPTEVVHEAYLRLVGQHRLEWQDRGHLFAVASREMRRILVDHARKRRAAKREGPSGQRITLSDAPDPVATEALDVLILDEALADLAAIDPRQAEILEWRYFGGLTVEEISHVAAVSPATVKRDLTTAKIWLRQRLATWSPRGA